MNYPSKILEGEDHDIEKGVDLALFGSQKIQSNIEEKENKREKNRLKVIRTRLKIMEVIYRDQTLKVIMMFETLMHLILS